MLPWIGLILLTERKHCIATLQREHVYGNHLLEALKFIVPEQYYSMSVVQLHTLIPTFAVAEPISRLLNTKPKDQFAFVTTSCVCVCPKMGFKSG